MKSSGSTEGEEFLRLVQQLSDSRTLLWGVNLLDASHEFDFEPFQSSIQYTLNHAQIQLHNLYEKGIITNI
jgi:hypothetical protein